MSSKVVNSVIWTGLERFGTQAFQAIFSIVLARLLMPEDYGLIAMIAVFLLIGQAISDGGLSLALVQKKDPTDDDFSTAFWFNIGFGLCFYVLFVLCAPLIARFYNEPQLISIIQIAGLNFIAWSLGMMHSTKLSINLQFKKHAFISTTSMLIGGATGVFLAYSGYGVWALVFQALITNSLKSLLVWVFGERWMPKFSFKMRALKSMFSFGSAFILSSMLDTIYKNLYHVFIGKRYSAGNLGYFQQSYTLSNMATTTVAYTILSSFIPLQAKLHDTPEEQEKLFLKFLSLLCFAIFPIALIFVALAQPAVSVVLTEKWLPIVPFLQTMCIAYLLYPVMLVNNRILLAKGFSKEFLTIEIVKKIVGFTAFFVCLPHGIFWVCVSLGIYTFFSAIVSIICTQKIVSIDWKKQLKIILPIFGIALFSGVLAYAAILLMNYYHVGNDVLKLLFGGVIGVGSYVFGNYKFRKSEELTALFNYVIKPFS